MTLQQIAQITGRLNRLQVLRDGILRQRSSQSRTDQFNKVRKEQLDLSSQRTLLISQLTQAISTSATTHSDKQASSSSPNTVTCLSLYRVGAAMTRRNRVLLDIQFCGRRCSWSKHLCGSTNWFAESSGGTGILPVLDLKVNFRLALAEPVAHWPNGSEVVP